MEKGCRRESGINASPTTPAWSRPDISSPASGPDTTSATRRSLVIRNGVLSALSVVTPSVSHARVGISPSSPPLTMRADDLIPLGVRVGAAGGPHRLDFDPTV